MKIENRQKLLDYDSDTTLIDTHPNFELAMQYVNQVLKYRFV